MKKIEKVAIIGMGALGVLYGEFFSGKLGSENVIFITDKDRKKRYETEGVYCNKKLCTFRMEEPNKSNEKVDLIVFAVKATALEEAVSSVGNFIDDNTIILSVLNGISSEEIIGSILGKERIIYCVAQGMDAVKIGNSLTYSHMGELCIGILENEKEKIPLLETVEEFFKRIELPYTLEQDIKRRMWSKWMLNVGVNQTVMVYEGTYRTIQEQGEPRDFMIRAMKEVIQIAQAEGVPVNETDLLNYVKLVDTLDPDNMPSMRQDGVSKRKSEVELFAGTVIRKAKELGIEVPVNTMLYKKVKEIEAGYK